MSKTTKWVTFLLTMILAVAVFLTAIQRAVAQTAPSRATELRVSGQASVGTKAAPNASSVLDLSSTTKGLLPPRMTEAQRDAIASPAAGLAVYNTDSNQLNIYNGSAWGAVAGSGSGASGDLLLNSDWNQTAANWTASGGTYARTTTAANIQPPSTGAGSWDSNASGQTLTSNSVTVTSGDGVSGANGAVAFWLKCDTGTCTHKIQAYDGTNVLNEKTITSSTSGFVLNSINFIFPTSGTVTSRVISVASNEPTLYLGRAFFGRAENFNLAKITGGTFFGGGAWAATASCAWGRTVNSFGDYTADTDCPTPTVRGKAAAPGTKIPALVFASFPRGNYQIRSTGRFYKDSAANAVCNWRFSDGVNFSAASAGYNANNVDMQGSISGGFYNATDRSNVTLIVQAANSDNTTNCSMNPADASYFDIEVYYFPDFDSDAYTPDKLGWVVYGTTAGADISLGTSTVASPTEIVSSSLTMTKGTYSLPVEVPCSSTNPSTGTTCSAGSEGLGVVYTQPTEGLVEACFDFTHQIVIGSNGPDISTFFRIVETENNAQTALQTGTYIARHRAGESDTPGQRPSFGPSARLCNLLYLQPGKRTLRLNFTQTVVNTLTSSTILDNTFAFSVKPLNQATPAPLIKNSVTSNSSGVERIERAHFTNTGSCAVETQSGVWIASVSDPGTGQCAITFSSGIFSAKPACSCSTVGGEYCALGVLPTVSGLSTVTRTDAGTLTDDAFDLICMGPR